MTVERDACAGSVTQEPVSRIGALAATGALC
jgi:hypothetical protein